MVTLIKVAVGVMIGAFAGAFGGAIIAALVEIIGGIGGIDAATLRSVGNAVTVCAFLLGIAVGGGFPFWLATEEVRNRPIQYTAAESHPYPFRSSLGRGLRLPVVALLALFWFCCVWWWLVLGAAIVASFALIIRPLVYFPLKILGELQAAFTNSREPVLPGYWSGYPDHAFDIVRRSANAGIPALRRWLDEGWS